LIDNKLKSLKIKLPESAQSVGSYIPVIITGNLVFVSGQISAELSSKLMTPKYKGKVGKNISLEDGQRAAVLCALNALGALRSALGNLDRIKKFVRVSGYINAEPSFTEHSKVINSASDLLLRVFGEKGRHTRIAVGVNSLPLDSAVELDMIVETESIQTDKI
jgi:enamine deaminase RidA (YjgF/YER057c/UK114 family)